MEGAKTRYYIVILFIMTSLLSSVSFRYGIPVRRTSISSYRQSATLSEVTPKIVPTPHETQLFDDLVDCVESMGLNTTVRVVGGWVRDRILGAPCKDDVDVTLDNMSGRQFVNKLHKYYDKKGVHMGMGFAKLNPNKSKHLETACGRIRNKFEVDFVHLRTETYSETSRVPVIEVGTPEEDAYRRDLTINSLSYNIHTKQVEDFTGKGLEDLQNKMIRTPLDPLVTLKDDPLRVLRIVRFTCRFNFNISPSLMIASMDPAVLESLNVKISRERVKDELEGCWVLRPRRVLRAMLLLHQFGVLKRLDVLSEPEKVVPRPGFEGSLLATAGRFTSEFGIAALLLANHLGDVSQSSDGMYGHLSAAIQRTDECSRRSHLLAVASLTLGSSMQSLFKVTANDGRLLSESMLLSTLGLSKKDTTAVMQIHRGAHAFHQLIAKAMRSSDPTSSSAPLTRLALGLAVRGAGEQYELSLLLGASLWYLEQALGESARQSLHLQPVEADLAYEIQWLKEATDMSDLAQLKSEKHFSDPAKAKNGVLPLIEAINTLLGSIDDWKLKDCYNMMPLLNGNEVIKALPKLQGPQMTEVMSYQVDWQLANPGASANDMLLHLKTKYGN